MRVTLGLGATTTAVPPSAAVGGARYPQAIQANPRPLPGPSRWVGTAEGARRSRPRPGVDPSGNHRQWSDRDDVEPGAARRPETDRPGVGSDRPGVGRPAADHRPGSDHRQQSDPSGSDRYRGSRQWSDRDASDRDRNDEWIARPGALYGTRPTTRASSPPPLRLRAPGVRVTPVVPARPVIPTRAPSVVPAGMPISDDSDPTPLFTATEFVAVGDSPLYQYVAELIAVGEALPSTDGTESPAPVNPPGVGLAPETRPSGLPRSQMQGTAAQDSVDGGKHRDERRVAGHRSAVDGSHRSRGRSPRHRAA